MILYSWELWMSRYHLKDVILGKIYFLLVRIKIKNMDLEIRRRESTGSGSNTHVETETLAKFELMDGAPVRGTLNCCLFCFITHAWINSMHIYSFFGSSGYPNILFFDFFDLLFELNWVLRTYHGIHSMNVCMLVIYFINSFFDRWIYSNQIVSKSIRADSNISKHQQ